MPRAAAAHHSSVGQAVETLVHAITGLVGTIGAAVQSAHEVGSGATDGKVAVPEGRGTGNRKSRSAASRAVQAAKMRAYWAKRKAEEGPTKASATKPSAKRAARAKPRRPGGAWASMTPEQRAERIAKMRAGRGLPS